MMEKRHIGDGVYVRHDGYHFVLETSAGVVFLDPWVLQGFLNYVKNFNEAKEIAKEVPDESIPV